MPLFSLLSLLPIRNSESMEKVHPSAHFDLMDVHQSCSVDSGRVLGSGSDSSLANWPGQAEYWAKFQSKSKVWHGIPKIESWLVWTYRQVKPKLWTAKFGFSWHILFQTFPRVWTLVFIFLASTAFPTQLSLDSNFNLLWRERREGCYFKVVSS